MRDVGAVKPSTATMYLYLSSREQASACARDLHQQC